MSFPAISSNFLYIALMATFNSALSSFSDSVPPTFRSLIPAHVSKISFKTNSKSLLRIKSKNICFCDFTFDAFLRVCASFSFALLFEDSDESDESSLLFFFFAPPLPLMFLLTLGKISSLFFVKKNVSQVYDSNSIWVAQCPCLAPGLPWKTSSHSRKEILCRMRFLYP